ncbi:MAG: CDP-alcohol phosphatidyltransferase family protein [Desulfopila sp.]
MSDFVYFIQPSPVRLWGLTSVERVERLLAAYPVQRLDRLDRNLGADDSILLMRGDYLFDDRLLPHLITTPSLILDGGEQNDTIVAVHAPGSLALQALAVADGTASGDTLVGFTRESPATAPVAYREDLRKSETPFVLPITMENKEKVERRLFDWSYKGITDLVTKWLWPRPARWAVGRCVQYRIRPNQVTIVSLVLVIIAGWCFFRGQFGLGLMAGWLMTYLDTVDGKLARVTMQSSRFGHYFDHLIDLIHPPIWYLFWGLGLGAAQRQQLGWPLATLVIAIFAGYIVGRLVEGGFQAVLRSSFNIFCWRPIDAYFRLVTARRNPCLILLTGSLLVGRPELGLVAVAFWTVVTTLFLLARLALAVVARLRQGTLTSWLALVDRPPYRGSLAARLFTRQAESDLGEGVRD